MQPTLFEENRFQQYHESNPQIYEGFKRFAFEAINRGAKHIGSKAIMERLRWETNIAAQDGEFKVNNIMTPFYARLFMKDFPKHRGLFATRRAKADMEIAA